MTVNTNVLVGQSLFRLRQCANLSVDDLAQQAGISRMAISRVESGRSAATQDLLKRIAPCLGLDLPELLDFVERAMNAGILHRTWRILRKRESWLSLEEARRELRL